jgi:ATP-dependent helicase/nuclease subunit B
MGLSLLVGPANAGKVARLLDGYVAAIAEDPVLIVPNRADVDRIERDLLRRSPALLGGSIGTFDDLFESIARGGNGSTRPVIRPAQRRLLLAQVVGSTSLNGLSASARFPGFTETLGDAIAELESALAEPGDVQGALAPLFATYRAELDRVGLWDRELERRHAAELVANELSAWDGRPVFAYGFEDLTGTQWALLEALAGRGDVTVSLPYRPARPVFASLRRTADDLSRLADGRIEELSARSEWYDAPALAYLERTLFEDRVDEPPPPLDGAVRFLEAAGPRAALELVGEDVLELIRAGTPAEEIALVCPGLDRFRTPLETAFSALGIPYAVEGTVSLDRTPFGRALLAFLRYVWLGGTRGHLFLFLRSRFSGLPRHRVDYVEGRLRGRAVAEPARVEEEGAALLGHSFPALAEIRGADSPPQAIRTAADLMLRAAYGLEAPPVGEAARLDLRAHEAVRRLAADLEGWEALGGAAARDQIVAALEGAPVRLAGPQEPGRIAVLDLSRARTRRFSAVFVLGLEEGSLPRRATESPFLPDDEREALEAAGGRRIARPDPLARDRYLFYTACTRPWGRLTLVRESATEDGRPQEASPFYLEVRGRFAADEVARWTKQRSLSRPTWEVERAPSERERLRAAAALAREDVDEARALARANGWERRVERALVAFDRRTELTNPVVLRELRETARFGVTELETFGTCSSLWFIDRVVAPKAIDAELDARLRGAVAHQALYRFYSGLPKRLGVERVEADRLEEALEYMRECLSEAIQGQARLDLSELDHLELEGTLARDLEHFLRQEVALGFPLVPRRFEVTFGTPGAPVELQRGLDLGVVGDPDVGRGGGKNAFVSGKIDRIDVDPFSARGIVQDYKSGSASHSADQIESEGRLQIPLYILALRDLVGIEPIGGLYRALAGSREARGLVLGSARDEAVPGLKRGDYVEEGDFWARVEGATERARRAVERVRGGDVRHDPRGGTCPSWCDRWPMCRVRRS